MANAYVQLLDVARSKNGLLGFRMPAGYPTHPRVVVVNEDTGLPDVCTGAPACFDPLSDRLILADRLVPSNTENRTTEAQALNLNTMAHEYGHFVSDTYQGPLSRSLPGTRATREGWANVFALRYALYRMVVRGDWASHYFMGMFTHGVFKHRDRLHHGEWTLEPLDGQGLKADNSLQMDLFWGRNPACADPELRPYGCSAPMSYVYWELAWNKARAPYLDTPSGAAILSHADLALTAANNAYSHAVVLALSGFDPYVFMYSAQGRYMDYFSDGRISVEDINRVQDVFSHHCVGGAEVCSPVFESNLGLHRYPGAPFPSHVTLKQNVVEGENGLRIGVVVDPVTGDILGREVRILANAIFWSGASGHAFSLLTPATSPVTHEFGEVPFAGDNRGILIAAGGWDAETEVRVRVNDGAWTELALPAPSGGWVWIETPKLMIPDGPIRVELDVSRGQFAVDSIVIDGHEFIERYCLCPIGDGSDGCQVVPP